MTAPHEASPHPPSEAPRPPQTTSSFAPGPGFVVALVVIVLIVVLALAAAVSSALGAMGVSRLLGGAALVLVGAGLVVALRVPARSVVVNAPRLRLERSRARAGRRAERARAESARAENVRSGEGGPGPAGRAGAEPGALMTRPTAGALATPASSRRELTTLDVVSGPVTTALAASGVGRAADERLAGTTTGEALLRVAQLLAGALGFVLMALGLASILGQVLR